MNKRMENVLSMKNKVFENIKASFSMEKMIDHFATHSSTYKFEVAYPSKLESFQEHVIITKAVDQWKEFFIQEYLKGTKHLFSKTFSIDWNKNTKQSFYIVIQFHVVFEYSPFFMISVFILSICSNVRSTS